MVMTKNSLKNSNENKTENTPLKNSTKRKNAPRQQKINPSMVDNTLKCRHEMKYVITESKTAAITKFIQPYVHYDRYCKLQPNHIYPIVSLYLDSANLKLCRESLEGHKNRFKLRIRSYSDDHDYPRFLEIKRRINTIILKSRAKIRHVDIDRLLSGRNINPQNKTDEDILRQFQLYMHSINAGPVVRIRYMRQAYENDSENRVRITFDTDLCYNIQNSNDLSLNGRNWQRHSLKGVILEIKFTGRYPAWINRMVECFDLRRRSMSKYATSLQNAHALGFTAPVIPMQYLT
ncbi:MAG: polyphosphate polymerase domain-containing protein [Planctomycetes bacterium]|nr:polyphosphate polymerase domain-containing protein [Planctomycetota bacterium]